MSEETPAAPVAICGIVGPGGDRVCVRAPGHKGGCHHMSLRCAPIFPEERPELQFAHDANSAAPYFCRKGSPFQCALFPGHDGDCITPLFGRAETGRSGDLAAEVGPTAPTVTHQNGGMESATPFAMHLIPPRALLELGRAMQDGMLKGYPPDNWKLIPAIQHLNHALVHIAAHLDGDTSDAHLAHAACRLMFAIECEPQCARAKYPGISES